MVLPGPFHSGFVRPGPFLGPCSAALARLMFIILSLQEILGVRNIFLEKWSCKYFCKVGPSQLKFCQNLSCCMSTPCACNVFFSLLLMNGFFFTHLLKHNRAIGLEWSCCSIAAVACNILLICAKLTIKNQLTNYVCQKIVSNLACNCGISFW